MADAAIDWGKPPGVTGASSTPAPAGAIDWGKPPALGTPEAGSPLPSFGQDWGKPPNFGTAQEFRDTVGKLTTPFVKGTLDTMQAAGVPIDALKEAVKVSSPMYQFLDYPANWAMKFVGSRVSSLATTVAKNLLEGNLPGPLAVGKSIVTGVPQEDAGTNGLVSRDIQGLDPETPTYSMLRQKGLPPDQAATAAMLLEGVAAGPINEIGGGALKGAGTVGSLLRATGPVQKLAEATAPVGRLFSRTYELTPADKQVIDEAVFQGRGIQNMTQNQFDDLGKQFMDAAKTGSKARGEPVESALTRMGTAQENLARMDPEKALEGLTSRERTAVTASRDALAEIPGVRDPLSMAPNELNAELPNLIRQASQKIVAARASGDPTDAASAVQALKALEDTGRVAFAQDIGTRKIDLAAADRLLSSVGASDVGYIPRIADQATAEARAAQEGLVPGTQSFQGRVSDLRTGPMPQRSLPSDVTTEEAGQKGMGFLPQSEALPLYGARQGSQMRNASIVSSVLRNLSKPAEEAPKGWLDPGQLGLMGGMSDAFKSQYQNARVAPQVFRYLQDWDKVSLPSSEAAIAGTRAKILSFWKPLVTTIRPEFLERFAGWHFAKSVIDGNTDPENYIDGILAASGKQLNLPVQDVPGISTVGELRDAAIKAGAIGTHGKQDFNTLVGSRLNSGIYDATKTSYLVDRLRKGDSLQDAAKATREALFDYDPANFTQFENFLRRNVAPFYAFRRQIIPAFARTAVGRAGSLGFAHQVVADINASEGFSNEAAGALLPGGETSGVLVSDPNAPTARKIMGSPFRDINQSMGQQGQGIGGYWNGLVSMLAPDISTLIQQGTGKNTLGQDLGKNMKLPSVARLMPQSVRDKLGVYEENGELKGPGRLAQLLYESPPPVNALVDLSRGDANAQKFFGAAPADTANVSNALFGIEARRRAALEAMRQQRRR